MTQLDRLEALAKKARETLEEPWTDEDAAFLFIVLRELPDLIRVARTAKELVVRPESGVVPAAFVELQQALAPLFAEVES